ncbi:MAG: fibronectin type III domain-containing protein, partial [Thermoplasmata archaeon]|nr:fibronectin type III domain-containing protein [Thermoplasmata archaeon]
GVDGFGDVPYDMIVSWRDIEDMYPFMTPVTQRFEKPDIPQNFSAVGGDGSVRLTWSAPVSDGGAPIINYIIYRSEGTGNKSSIAIVQDAFYYIDTNVTNDVTYHYIISAVNTAGDGPNSTEVTAKPTIKPIPDNGNGDDGGDSSIFLYVGILIILIWVVTILITLLAMRRKTKRLSLEKQQPKKSPEKRKKTDEKLRDNK